MQANEISKQDRRCGCLTTNVGPSFQLQMECLYQMNSDFLFCFIFSRLSMDMNAILSIQLCHHSSKVNLSHNLFDAIEIFGNANLKANSYQPMDAQTRFHLFFDLIRVFGTRFGRYFSTKTKFATDFGFTQLKKLYELLEQKTTTKNMNEMQKWMAKQMLSMLMWLWWWNCIKCFQFFFFL